MENLHELCIEIYTQVNNLESLGGLPVGKSEKKNKISTRCTRCTRSTSSTSQASLKLATDRIFSKEIIKMKTQEKCPPAERS